MSLNRRRSLLLKLDSAPNCRRFWQNRIVRFVKFQAGASGSCSIRVATKSKRILNPMDQISHEESHFSNYQSLLNQDMEWLGDQKQKLNIWFKVSQITNSRNDDKVKTQVATWRWKKEKWQYTSLTFISLLCAEEGADGYLYKFVFTKSNVATMKNRMHSVIY
jgi:hypothetical protein